MKRIVIMQPYYIPWYGFFEQIKLADIYVFYDDVQYIKRSLMNRVDIKTKNGSQWMTVPLKKVHQRDLINEVICHEESNWRTDHLNRLRQAYKDARYFNEMNDIAMSVYGNSSDNLSDVTITAIKTICAYFYLDKNTDFYVSSELKISGKGTQRLYDIAAYFEADTYLTGMGALRYLDYEYFTSRGIEVEFINYAKTPYPQLYGEFNPYVTILDLIANTGIEGVRYMNSNPVHYKTFLDSQEAKDYLKNNEND